MEKRKVIYYEDEHNDEFSTTVIKTKRIDENYRYERDSFGERLLHFFIYKVFATPLAALYLKLKFSHRIVGKEKIKPYKKESFFMFANHTQDMADAYIPSMVSFPKDAYIIAHPNNVSMPVLGRVTPYLGAIPLPDTFAAHKKFLREIEKKLDKGCAVVIYPEAHIWPYYTKIRDFADTSFSFPVKHRRPVFAFTNTYQKKRFSKEPKIVTYIDGPFFPDESLSPREARKKLRDEVHAAMTERAKLSGVVKIEYIKKENSL